MWRMPENHRIVGQEGASMATESSPPLKTGIQTKAELGGRRWPNFLLKVSSTGALIISQGFHCPAALTFSMVFPGIQPKSGFWYLEPVMTYPALWDGGDQESAAGWVLGRVEVCSPGMLLALGDAPLEPVLPLALLPTCLWRRCSNRELSQNQQE